MNARGSWRPHAEVPRKPEAWRVREGGERGRGRGRAGSARAGAPRSGSLGGGTRRAAPTVLTCRPGGRCAVRRGLEGVRARESGWELESGEREARGRERGKEAGRKERSGCGLGVGGAGCGGGGKSRLSKSRAGPGSAWLLTWAVEAGKGARGKRRLVG